MPDLETRNDHEDEVAALILLYLRHIDFDLRDGVAPDWQEWSSRLSADLAPILATAFLLSASQLKQQFGLTATPALEQQAAEWAARQSQSLANGVATRTRAAVAEAEAALLAEAEAAALAEMRAAQQAMQDAASMEARLAAEAEIAAAQAALESTIEIVQAQIPAELEAVLGAERAEAIGITETTNAITEGESAAASDIQGELGVTLKPYWVTEADDRVCPVCRPLHGRPRDEWWAEYGSGPPAHPSCRCTLDWRAEA